MKLGVRVQINTFRLELQKLGFVRTSMYVHMGLLATCVNIVALGLQDKQQLGSMMALSKKTANVLQSTRLFSRSDVRSEENST